MFYKNTKVLFLLIVLLSSILFGGCDKYKEDRAKLLKDKNTVETELVKLKSQKQSISQNIESLTSEINSQTQSLQESTKRHTKLKDTLSAYILEHKLATVAIIATGGGAAAVISENVDEDTKGVLTAVVIIGAIYCISNYQECADVTSKIMYYGSQINGEEKAIKKLKSGINKNKSALEKNKQDTVSLSKSIDKKNLRRNSLQEKHDSLLCKFCF